MLNFTQQERQAILFLIIVTLTGILTNFLIKIKSPKKTIACFNQDIGKINPNTADKDMLMDVPGIGTRLAQRIIEYRQQHGAFREIEELKKIERINAYRYEKIKGSFVIK